MPDINKININGSLIPDFKSHFSITRPERSLSLAYGIIFTIIALATFFAFTPNTNSSPIYDFFIPKQTTSILEPSTDTPLPVLNQDQLQSDTFHDKVGVLEPKNDTVLSVLNQTAEKTETPPQFDQNEVQSDRFHDKVGILEPKNDTLLPSSNQTVESHIFSPNFDPEQVQTEILHPKNGTFSHSLNQTVVIDERSSDSGQNQTQSIEKEISENGKKDGKGKKGMKEVIKSLVKCDLYDGKWVRDESYPLYKPGSCSLIDEQFDCFNNGRPDNGYQKFKWKPKGCTLPRLRGRRMLKILRGKRLVFVGDSLNRNMWESLICILKNSVKDPDNVYEESGRYQFRNEGSYSFVFKDYNTTVEFFVSPFLVQRSEATDKNGTVKETLRLDLIATLANNYSRADIIVFNTGEWWNPYKSNYGKNYYQEGSHVYPHLDDDEAFRKGLTTWGRWVDDNVDPAKTLVFFRGGTESHYSGGQWNSGGACGNETEPIMDDNYLREYPSKMKILERVLRGMETQVTYLNITKLTDYRKDGHPSLYRTQNFSPLVHQDCSHWCLPGVPDTWNELLYAELLVNLYNSKPQ